MISSAAMALVLGASQASLFSKPFEVAETERLAWTPVLDGVISEEEWDVLASGENWLGAFQWEPRHLHVGGKYPTGQDLIVSVDKGNNGWLVGKENFEFRFSNQSGKVSVKVRQLDATPKEGPKWVALPGFEMASRAASSPVDGGWALEASLTDPNTGEMPGDGDRIGIRYDLVPSETVVAEPFLPRPMAPVRLTMDRSLALPPGLKFSADSVGRSIVPGESTKVRFLFNGNDKMDIKELSIRAEGPLRDQVAKLSTPFPSFDSKGRSFVDYGTTVSKDASVGYRVLRGALGLGDGPPSFVQASIQIANLVEAEITPIEVSPKPNAQTKKFPIYLRSYSQGRIDGELKLTMPNGWKIGEKDATQAFTIYTGKGRIRKVFEATIPANEQGSFPIQATITVGKKVTQQILWLTFPQ